jgi:amino acid permease
MNTAFLPLITLLLGVLVLSVLGAVIVFNFIRYRFENDKTVTIMLVFAVAILSVLIGTIVLLQVPRQSGQVEERPSSTLDNFM